MIVFKELLREKIFPQNFLQYFKYVFEIFAKRPCGSIVACYRLSGSIQLDCTSPREGMPEYISRYINLSASRWFPRRIQEVISGTSMRSPVGSLARALSRERERERASSRGGGNGSSSNQPCAIRTCTPFEWQRERREYIREEGRRLEGEGETRKREREIAELGVERTQEEEEEEEEIVDWWML